MANTEYTAEADQTVRFKKRRKITHQRRAKYNDDSDDETANTNTSTSLLPPLASTSDEKPSSIQPAQDLPAPMSVPEILRKRQAEQAQRKLKSVVMASTRNQKRPDETAMVEVKGKEEETVLDVARGRFVPETGRVVEKDLKMDEYVDRKMAELYGASTSTSFIKPSSGSSTVGVGSATLTTTTTSTKPGRYNGNFDDAVFGGRLVEVEIDQDAESQRVAAPKKNGKKTGLGPDGKPWRSRERRNSADIRRDQLVDEVLRETDMLSPSPPKQDLYTTLTPLEQSHLSDQAHLDNQAIDELVAAKWRNNYLAAQADGKSFRRVPAPPPGPKGEERPKGPKLGGSRMARQMMRDREEKAAKGGGVKR